MTTHNSEPTTHNYRRFRFAVAAFFFAGAAFAGSGMMTPKWMSSLFCSAGERWLRRVDGPILAVIRSGDLEVFVDSLEFTFEQPIASFTDPEVGFGVVFVERAFLLRAAHRDLPESGVGHEVEVNVGRLAMAPRLGGRRPSAAVCPAAAGTPIDWRASTSM